MQRCFYYSQRLVLGFLMVLLLPQLGLSQPHQPEWKKISVPFDPPFEKIMGGTKDSTLFLTSEQNAYRIQKEGDSWEKIFRLGKRGYLNGVYPAGGDKLFILTTEGVFETKDRGRTWQKSFSALEKNGTNSLSLSSHPRDPEILYLGTAQGLYLSMDGGQSWFKQNGSLARSPIRFILPHSIYENQIFIVTDQNFYRSHDYGRSFRKTFHSGRRSDENLIPEENGIPDEKENPATEPLNISAARISPFRPEEIFLGTSGGVFMSRDLGNTWAPLPRNGLGNASVTDIAISDKDGTVFVSTASGIYFFKEGRARWVEMYAGLSESAVKSLALLPGNGQETLYAVTDKNIFQFLRELPSFPEIQIPENPLTDPSRIMDLRALIAREPTALEIQRAAIRYADVGNGKIKRWQIASRLKALVPDLSLGRDLSIRNNIDLDRSSTNQADFFIEGPDSTTAGKDISLDWELSDLIWGSDQTSIDSREKLMVELRNDLVNEVTRLYFERRRLLLELYLTPPEHEKDKLDLLLRIDELTSYIDGLTGGYFTRELQKRGIIYSQSQNF